MKLCVALPLVEIVMNIRSQNDVYHVKHLVMMVLNHKRDTKNPIKYTCTLFGQCLINFVEHFFPNLNLYIKLSAHQYLHRFTYIVQYLR